ncbi:MAG: phosphopyruvate hydratase [Acidimicrobiales bacterium]
MSSIQDIHAREILDSRGNPTVEVEVLLESGADGRAAAPSGASTGIHEAVELRDGTARFAGLGVLRAIVNVNEEMSGELVGMEALDQRSIDFAMIDLDGTPSKSRLGANAIIATSIAVAKAAAVESGLPLYRYIGGSNAHVLPLPHLNVMNGGAHADNPLDLQEFLLMPVGAASFAEALRWGAETYHALQSVLKQKGMRTAVGDEGGFAPDVATSEECLAIMVEAVQRAGLEPGKHVSLALDAAPSGIFRDGSYHFVGEGKVRSIEEMVSYYEMLCDNFPIVSLEDPMAEEDWEGWEMVTERLGGRVQVVGDDIFVTNRSLLGEGIRRNVANSILIKLNQIGTVTETLDTMKMAFTAGYSCVVSHRSGETEDVTLVHLAVGTNCGQVKTGAPARTERVAKYNELLRIEEGIGTCAEFGGSLKRWAS